MAAAIGAQCIWGGFPAFIKLFQGVVQPVDFVAHRAIWSLVFLVACLTIASKTRNARTENAPVMRRLYGNSTAVFIGLLATIFLVTNWLMFVWAVSNNHSLDASLGYYICPQIVVLLGVVFLRERLGVVQWLAVAICTVGVVIMTWSAQSNIWIGLVVAIAFGLYALVKKKTPLAAIEGLTVETSIMLLPAIAFLCWRSSLDGWVVWPEANSAKILLLLSGPITVAPLFLYSVAVKHISLATVGLLQFIGPTLQFFLGAFVFGEPLDSMRLFGFVFVWIGVGIYLYAIVKMNKTDG